MKKMLIILMVFTLVFTGVEMVYGCSLEHPDYRAHLSNLETSLYNCFRLGLVPDEIKSIVVEPEFQKYYEDAPKTMLYPISSELVKFEYSSEDIGSEHKSEPCPFCGKGRLYVSQTVVHGPFNAGDQRICIHKPFGVDRRMYTITVSYYSCTVCTSTTATTQNDYYWECNGFYK